MRLRHLTDEVISTLLSTITSSGSQARHLPLKGKAFCNKPL